MPNNVRAMIAAEVRAELARQNKTQRDLADRLRITQPSVQLRLSGQRPFRAEELAVIADWLGVPPAQFLPPLNTSTAA